MAWGDPRVLTSPERERLRLVVGKMQPMTKSAVAQTVDEVLATVVAPTLKQRGFRRQGRHWWLSTPDVVKVVTALGSRFNTPNDAMFTLEMGFSYVGLGQAAPTRWEAVHCAHRCRIGDVTSTGADLWWRFDIADLAQVARVTTEVERVWGQDGLPFVDACSDPNALRDWGVRTGKLGLELADLGLLLGDRVSAEGAVDAYLSDVRSYDPGEPSQHHPYPQTLLLGPYSVVVPYLRRLGRQLPEADRRRVVDAFAAARDAAAEGRYRQSPGRNAELVRELAREVDVDVSDTIP